MEVRVNKILGRSMCAALLVMGCGGDGQGDDSPGKGQGGVGRNDAPLRALDGCDALAEVIRENAIIEMNKRVDQAQQSYLANQGCWEESPTADAGDAAGDDSSGGGGSVAPPTDVSGTNNQVAGVDEADMVKNDGHYLYVVSNGALHIIEAWPAANTKEVAKVEFTGEPRKLFVQGDRALVYTASTDDPYYSECTYGYDCDFSGDGSSTTILVYDIKDRAKPVKVREVALTGSLVAARRIGNAVHTVVSDGAISFEGLSTFPEDLSYCGEPLIETVAKLKFDALRKKNEQTIRNADVLAKLPQVNDSVAGAKSLLASCQGFYATAVQQGAAFTTVLSLDMSAEKAATSATVVSRPGAVYASESGLYMAVRDNVFDPYAYYGGDEGSDPLEETSAIHRFRIGDQPELTAYEASGQVPGHVIGQFAMDEHADKLRVATSIGWVPDERVNSAVSVLGRNGKELVLAGQVKGLAPKEDIRSVRFDGDRGFIVTFKKTDPLFVLDLKDPEKPSVLSELKIPGFSTYMHLMDENHLLTIGYDADDQGDFAWFAGIQLQIFDVSDPKAPKLAHKHLIGTRGSTSEAATNHLAFNYFAKKNLLALPMQICEGGSGGSYGTDMTFNGLMVFDVTAEGGFNERGRVSHPGFDGSYDDNLCMQWWAGATTGVKRSVIMDDFVYSIASDMVRVQSLAALGTDIASVSIAGKPCEQGGKSYPDDSFWTVPATDDMSCSQECSCQEGVLSCNDSWECYGFD
jgi:hypothetical protein